ncbi:MAG TPA: hypothetical protein VMC42_03700 [Methanoregulaceae archaeon]|nr:hypothetical protein [Methanoregulaceae archaeon]
MRIVRSKQSRVCVDGSLLKEFLLDEALTEEFIGFLYNFGSVRLFSHMKMPYFSFESEDFISVKGFVGDPVVEVRYRQEYADLTGDYFHLLLFYYRDGKPGIGKMKAIELSIRAKIETRKG